MAKITLDFRLYRVPIELAVLERNLELIQDQIEWGRKAADEHFDKQIQRLNPTDPHFESDLSFLMDERNFQVEFVQPRILRGPFLVSMFAVYESTVTEAARLIERRQGKKLSIKDIRGGFLDQAGKYFKNVLEFDLSTSNTRWQRLKLLSKLRNAIAHTNGRLDMIGKNRAEDILKVEGVSEEIGCIVVTGEFLRETFETVKEDLEDLIDRVKQWDEASKDKSQPDC